MEPILIHPNTKFLGSDKIRINDFTRYNDAYIYTFILNRSDSSRVRALVTEGSLVKVLEDNAVLCMLDFSPILDNHDVLKVMWLNASHFVFGVVVSCDDFAEDIRPLTPNDLNPDRVIPCNDSYSSSISSTEYFCQRPQGHVGRHQCVDTVSIHDYVYTEWSDAGAKSTWSFPLGAISPCTICGFMHTEGEGEVCFSCQFWLNQASVDRDNAFVINGRHYRPKQGGFYGKTFHVKRFDGTVWSGELFTQGEIPKYMRELLPDNAEFISG